MLPPRRANSIQRIRFFLSLNRPSSCADPRVLGAYESYRIRVRNTKMFKSWLDWFGRRVRRLRPTNRSIARHPEECSDDTSRAAPRALPKRACTGRGAASAGGSSHTSGGRLASGQEARRREAAPEVRRRSGTHPFGCAQHIRPSDDSRGVSGERAHGPYRLQAWSCVAVRTSSADSLPDSLDATQPHATARLYHAPHRTAPPLFPARL